jgi:hypothetical protein
MEQMNNDEWSTAAEVKIVNNVGTTQFYPYMRTTGNETRRKTGAGIF